MISSRRDIWTPKVRTPEDGIKACIWDVAHMPPVSDQTVNGVVHVLKGVVGSAAAVAVRSVGKRCVVGLIGDQLVSRVVDELGIGLELQVGQIGLTLPGGTGIAHGAVILCDRTVGGWEVRGRRLRVESVVVQRISDVRETLWRVHSDHGTIDWVGHSSVQSPVPL